MTSQITPKHMLDNQILLKLWKIFNSMEINPNSTYPLSEPSVHLALLVIKCINLGTFQSSCGVRNFERNLKTLLTLHSVTTQYVKMIARYYFNELDKYKFWNVKVVL